MNGIIKIIQALEDSNILLKGVTKTIKNEIKEQKGLPRQRTTNTSSYNSFSC